MLQILGADHDKYISQLLHLETTACEAGEVRLFRLRDHLGAVACNAALNWESLLMFVLIQTH